MVTRDRSLVRMTSINVEDSSVILVATIINCFKPYKVNIDLTSVLFLLKV